VREERLGYIEIIDVFVCVNMREACVKGMREGMRAEALEVVKVNTIQPLGNITFIAYSTRKLRS